jgi:hypothetical protein
MPSLHRGIRLSGAQFYRFNPGEVWMVLYAFKTHVTSPHVHSGYAAIRTGNTPVVVRRAVHMSGLPG